MSLLMLTILSGDVFFMVQLTTRAVGQDAWITAQITSLWACLIIFIILGLGRLYPGKTLVEYIPLIIGRLPGRFLGMLYAVWFLLVTAMAVDSFGLFLNTTILTTTSPEVFVLSIMVLVFYALRSGLEVWARVNEILLPLVIAAILIVLCLALGVADFRRVLPVGEHSVGELLASSITPGSMRGLVLAAAMLIPALRDQKNLTRNLIGTVVGVGLILSLVNIMAVAVFGPENCSNLEFPFYNLARMIDMARIITRMELFIVLIWVFGVFIQICTLTYCSTMAAAQVAGVTKYQPLMFPIFVLITALATSGFQDVVQLRDFLESTWGGFGLLSFELTIPLLLYAAALLRKRHEVQKL